MAKAPPVKWTREHFLIALNLYCTLPFGRFHNTNPIIIEVASKMGRTPDSLEMQLNNFASIDPVQQARGIKGLPGISHKAIAMWEEYFANISTLGPESEQLRHDLFTDDQTQEVDFLQRDKVHIATPTGNTETQATVKLRRGQQWFRQSILSAYNIHCCISGINVPSLLVASHIKPWGQFPNDRLNPKNGLCLSTLHDAAFDAGLITLDNQFSVVLSNHLRGFFPQRMLKENFVRFEGKPIRLPEKLTQPDSGFIRYHRETIFKS